MTRATVLIVCVIAISQLVTAQISVHDFKIEEKHRSQQLTVLIKEATKTYPELAGLKLEAYEDELDAILRIGRELASSRDSMQSRMRALDVRVEMFKGDSLSREEKEELLQSLKKTVQEMQAESDDIRVLTHLATMAYRLAKTFEPPTYQRSDWIKTWRVVKRLVSSHL